MSSQRNHQIETPAEIYAKALQNTDPSHFGPAPAIMYVCTYIDNSGPQPVRKKLSGLAMALYTAIRNISGPDGICWASRDTLCEMISCGHGALTRAKKELCQPMEQLNGKSLIILKKKRRYHKENIGCCVHDEMTVVNIWGENRAYMLTRHHQKKLELGVLSEEERERIKWKSGEVESNKLSDIIEPIDVEMDNLAPPKMGDQDLAPPKMGAAPQGAPPKMGTNNRNNSKSNSVREQKIHSSQGSDDPACYVHAKTSVMEEEERIEKEKAREYMTKYLTCDNSFINEMLRNYPVKQIKEGVIYFQKQMQRIIIRNPNAYLRNAIENGRVWENR